MNTRPISLTLRLTLLFSIAAAVVFSGFGWFIENSIKNHFKDGDIAELRIITDHVSQTLSTYHAEEEPIVLQQRLNDLLVGHHGAVLHIVGQDGNVFFANLGHSGLASEFSQVTTTATANNSTTYLWSDARHTYRVLSSTMNSGTTTNTRFYTVFVAVVIDHHLLFLENFQRALWLMIACGFVVMGLMGWFAVRQGYAPLYNIVTQVRHISASKLNTRLLPEKVPRELTELAVSFNEHLQRMEESFQQLSNFSADIAHELRTPVTSLMTQTQVALSQTRSVAEYQEVLYSNVEEYERIAQMISDMLFIAKADNGLAPPHIETIDLKNELDELCDYYGLWAEENNISLTLEGSAKVMGDRLMLQRAFSNLISNAIHYTASGEQIAIKISANKNTVLIEVKNPGNPIPPHHLSKLFDRFYRIDSSRQRNNNGKGGGEGIGLGLAIVKAIVEAHNGSIAAYSDTTGTRFQISLPTTDKVSNQTTLRS